MKKPPNFYIMSLCDTVKFIVKTSNFRLQNFKKIWSNSIIFVYHDLENMDMVMSYVVLEELDGLKKNIDRATSKKATEAQRNINNHLDRYKYSKCFRF